MYWWQSVPATWRNVGIDISVDDLMSTKKPSTTMSSPMKQLSSTASMCLFPVGYCHIVFG